MSLAEAQTVLAKLRAHGVVVWAEGERLRYRPKGAVTEAQVATLRRHKQTLIALLGADDAGVGWRLEALRQRYPRVAAGRPAPFLLVADLPITIRGCCPSCGEPLDDERAGAHQRCRPCLLAINLFLVSTGGG